MKAQQLITMDEVHAGQIEEGWIKAVIEEQKIVPERLPAEITSERVNDTNVTTIWCENRPIAYAIRQRTEFNCTVLTTVCLDPPPKREPKIKDDWDHRTAGPASFFNPCR